MQLFFIRHAESMANMTGDYSVEGYDGLSPKGFEQADHLAELLDTVAFDFICTSPIERAVGTILPYLRRKSMVAEIWPEIAEACWQKERNITAPSAVRYGEPVVLPEGAGHLFRFRADDKTRTYPPSDESYAEGFRRLQWSCNEILRRFNRTDRRVLVVSHIWAMSIIIEMLLNIDPIARFKFDNIGRTLLAQAEDGSFHVKYVNRI